MSIVPQDPDSNNSLRDSLIQWLAEHEDHEHNALPPVAAHPLVHDAFDRKLETWADELLSGPLASLLLTADFDPIETSLEACSAALAEMTRQRDDLLRLLRGGAR